MSANVATGKLSLNRFVFSIHYLDRNNLTMNTYFCLLKYLPDDVSAERLKSAFLINSEGI